MKAIELACSRCSSLVSYRTVLQLAGHKRWPKSAVRTHAGRKDYPVNWRTPR